MNTREEIENKRKELEALQNRLEQEEMAARAARQKPLRKIAEKLHDACCRWNHTDGCAWEYEVDRGDEDKMWEMQAHRRYLNNVEKILKDYSQFTAESLQNFADDFFVLHQKYPSFFMIFSQLS